MEHTLICQICGKEFKSAYSGKKYCSFECAYEQEKRNARRRYLENSGALKKRPASKTCPVCGKEFKPMTNRAVYCSLDCAKEAQKKKARDRYYEAKPDCTLPKKECPVCGKMFTPRHGNAVYCSPECRRGAMDAMDDFNQGIHREKPKESVSDVVRKCSELHITYGKYVELKERGEI